MFKIMNKSRQHEYLRAEDFLDFPRIELKIIDRLWRKYSDEKFGFSVQKKIWIDCGGKHQSPHRCHQRMKTRNTVAHHQAVHPP
jgi:hypothetical protein